MILKRAPIFALLCALVLSGCGIDFSRSMYVGLRVSQISWEEAMNAVDQAEQRDDIDADEAAFILKTEKKYRDTHNQIESMTEHWLELGKLSGTNADQVEALQWKIIAYQTELTELLAEMVGFLRQIGVL